MIDKVVDASAIVALLFNELKREEIEDDLLGHCVVAEFTYEAYKDKANKERWIKVQDAL